MLLVLDSNEYIFSFGFLKAPSSRELLDIIVDNFPAHSLRLPRLVSDEVRRNLSSEEYKDFINLATNLTSIDEDFVVPFETGFKYETLGMKNPVASYRVSKSKELRPLLSFPLVGNPSSERFWTSQNDYKKRKVTL